MITVYDWKIIENKDEFLKKYDNKINRYGNTAMPSNFSLEKATFPMALEYKAPYWSNECGSWVIISIEDAKIKMIAFCEKEIEKYNNFKNYILYGIDN